MEARSDFLIKHCWINAAGYTRLDSARMLSKMADICCYSVWTGGKC